MARQKILAVPGTGRIDIHFDENLYKPDGEMLSEMAVATVVDGESKGFDLTRASEGCVVCYFNPTNMTLDQAQKGSKKMIEYIESCSTANA